jgi:hypothetical protein
MSEPEKPSATAVSCDTATAYYKRTGWAPPGQFVFIHGKRIDEHGVNHVVEMAAKDPNRLSKPKGWK